MKWDDGRKEERKEVGLGKERIKDRYRDLRVGRKKGRKWEEGNNKERKWAGGNQEIHFDEGRKE